MNKMSPEVATMREMVCTAGNSMKGKVGSRESHLYHTETFPTLQLLGGKNFKVKRKVRSTAIRDLPLPFKPFSHSTIKLIRPIPEVWVI